MVFPGRALADAVEDCCARGWTDGMPVIPCTEDLLESFLATTRRDPDEVLLAMPHLNRECTVRTAAINAVMAGCRPEYFPVILAAWDSARAEGYPGRAIWQSTTGTAPFIVVNGPIAEKLEVNAKGNVFGSGFRANATIGRAIRLTAINAFGLRPRVLDQATQGTPAKYTCCIAENVADSPWGPFHTDYGFAEADSTVTYMTVRSVLHVDARYTSEPEHLLRDFVNSVSRTGAMSHRSVSCALVLGPEHARKLSAGGWSKDDIKQFLYDEAVHSGAFLNSVGKDALSGQTTKSALLGQTLWRVPAGHSNAITDEGATVGPDDVVHSLTSPAAVQVFVAGAPNAGVSAIVETFGARGGPPAITRVEEYPS
jgi:hypothetical protein